MSVREFNLADLFELVVDLVPDRDALVADPVRLTYRQLEERSNRFAHYLQTRGIEPGQFVGILARNRAEWVEAMIGCFKARVAPVNLNYRYVAPELRYVVDNADLVALVYERALAPLVAESFAQTPPPGVLIVVDDAVTESGGADDGLATADDGLGAARYETALSSSSPDRDFDRRSPDDLYVLYTGGTTGLPKGVMWRHEDIFFAAMGGGGWGRVPVETAEEMTGRVPIDDAARLVILALAPLMHGNAQWGMWNGLVIGGTTVIYTEPSFDADKVLRLVDRERVRSLSLVGDAMGRPLAEALARTPDAYDTSSLVAVSSGGARFSDTVKAELSAQLPDVMIMDQFGSSESGAQGTISGGGDGPRFAMNKDTAVLDEDLLPLQPGDGRIGRLARRGHVPIGYFKDEAKTAATFPVDADGVRWSIPGDLATVEADGSITVHGRGSGSINSGGEKIFPEEVEAAVKTHPGVYDAIVVGVPDQVFGERVAVAVHARPGVVITLEDLQDHCRQHIAGYKIPRQLLLVEDIAQTAAGKPDVQAAKALFEAVDA
ncbi:MAG TPA: acyl-CoA synthetase [Acidimicrobiales bacterium]|nr:acyl-CoA synthetase [Acidimicrobiales bacterium]